MVLSGWKVGEGVALAWLGAGGSGWALRGGDGRADQSVPWVLPDPGRWSSGTPRPHRLPTAWRAPRSRSREGAPWVGTGGSEGKVWSPKPGSGGCGGAAAALGGVRLAEKSGRAAAAVCAKFWVARKDAGEGRRAEPRKLWPEPEGDPRRPPRQLADIGASGFCSPLASLGWVDAQPLNPSQPRGNNFILSEAAGLRLAGQRRGSRLCPFVVLRISPLILGFL